MSYPINKDFTLGTYEGSSDIAMNKYIIAHDTGNDNNKGPHSARNEASYMKGHWQNAYTQFIVDDTAIYQVGEPGYVSWGALNANPYAPVQIELAHVDSQARFNESYKRYIWLIRHYATKYHIPLTLDTSGSGVKTHKWVTLNYGGDHVDPYGYLAKWGVSKAKFAKDIKNGVGEVAKPKKPAKAEYFDWKPPYIYAKETIKAYSKASDVGTGKNVAKTYKPHTELKVADLAGKRFKLDNGLYITANKYYVNNLYYPTTSKVKVVKSVKGTNRYSDVALKKKVDHFEKGTEFEVAGIVKHGETTRIKLANGLYISGNKLINKFVE